MSAITTEEKPSFSLITKPWIRCVDVKGNVQTLSLSQVFAQARQLVRLSGESPAQDYAVLRVLLVVLWRAHRNDPRLSGFDPDGMSDWWLGHFLGEEELSDPIVDYLEEHADRFYLFHPLTPFMQVADLRTAKGGYDGVSKLIPDSESGYFSMRAGEGLDSLAPAEAARWLIAIQAWNYSGIKSGALDDERVKGGKGYPIGTGWSGRAGGVALHGRNLAETLILNSVPTAVFGQSVKSDLPVWERNPDTQSSRGVERSSGPSDLLTWQSRRIRLFAGGNAVVGALVANGDRVEQKNHFNDPMTAYRYSKNQSSKTEIVHMPKAHSVSRTLWRGIEPLLVRQGVVGGPEETRDHQPQTVEWLHQVKNLPGQLLGETVIGVELVGMVYGPQDSTISATVHEELPLRLALLADSDDKAAHLLVTATSRTMEAAVAVGQFSGRLAQAAGGTYAFDLDATETVLDQLNEPFKSWLENFTPSSDPVAARDRWFEHVRVTFTRYAQELVRGAGPRALLGREDGDGRFISAATAWNTLNFELGRKLERSQSLAPQPAAS